MSATTVEVRSRAIGATPATPDLAPVFLRLMEERLTVAELIRRTVEEQVRELLARRALDGAAARRALDRQYLSAEEVAAQARQGAVRYPATHAGAAPQLDVEAEVAKAQRAFAAGAYRVLVDGWPAERLGETISFAPGSTITFLRLTPLIGG
jgi:hypothetical protein